MKKESSKEGKRDRKIEIERDIERRKKGSREATKDGKKEGRKEEARKVRRKEGMKEVRKEGIHLPDNCAASRTDPTHTIPAKSPLACANLPKKKFSFQNFYLFGYITVCYCRLGYDSRGVFHGSH